MSGRKRTVFIVDDDPDFVELMTGVFNSDSRWEVSRTFSSLESMLALATRDEAESRKLLPDLMVLDVFASHLPPTEVAPVTGYHVALVLRDMGFEFGTLIMSSMSSPTLLSNLRSQYPEGWSYLAKSALLTPELILEAAEEALIL